MKIFFTPGPTQLYPSVSQHITNALNQQICSISHRSPDFQEILKQTVSNIKELMGIPTGFKIFFHASATEIWERLLQNCVSNQSFHFVNGSFSDRYYKAAKQLKLQAMAKEADWGEGFQFQKRQIPSDVEMINFTHNETSTGVMLPVEEIHAFRESHPQALITVDMVSSAPYINLDWCKIDAGYFSVQKCFGLPAGLGVLALNQRCLQKEALLRQQGLSTGTYHSFQAQYEKAIKNQTVETPNMLAIYLLGKVCEDMLSLGIARIRKETEVRANRLYTYFEQHPEYTPFVADPRFRSKTVVLVDTAKGSQKLISYLAERGLIVGDGYGKMKGKQIRIANFPAISMMDIERLIKGIENFSTGNKE